MNNDDKALVERLRDDWPEILVEKHWMMDSDAIDKQREEAADRIEALSAEIERFRELLSRNIDDEPCWRDHHGYCQAHYLEEDCSVAAARAALGETK